MKISCTYCSTVHGLLRSGELLGGSLRAPHLLSFRDLWTLDDLPDASSAVHSTITTAVLWNVWKARNNVVFCSSFVSVSLAVRSIVSDLELWAYRCKSPSDAYSLQMWAQCLVT
jgi:hypothetical protein